ncbi:hypothetical protein [Pseudomonas sp. RL_5y_Pfl2_73]|uniref:hypothetical protein n=1 Tax=Pseudomonas sp. RL_5y_Pfl2_73 TaxID=3088713 RepID=UPI0030D83800
MNSLAQQALDRARKAVPASKLLPPIVANEHLPDLVITGPINRVMFLEGKRYAVDFVQALGASIRNPKVVAKAAQDLALNAEAQPYSRAQGIKEVIQLLEVTS